DAGPTEQRPAGAAHQPVALRIETPRGDRPEIDDLDAFLLSVAPEQEPDAADAAHPRLDPAQREGGPDGGVDRIAPPPGGPRAGLGGACVLRHDDAFARDLRRLRDRPVLSQRQIHVPPVTGLRARRMTRRRSGAPRRSWLSAVTADESAGYIPEPEQGMSGHR